LAPIKADATGAERNALPNLQISDASFLAPIAPQYKRQIALRNIHINFLIFIENIVIPR